MVGHTPGTATECCTLWSFSVARCAQMRIVYIPHTMRLPLYENFPIGSTIKILYFAFVRYLVYLQGKGGGLFYEMRNISIPRRIIKRDCLSVRTFQLRWRAHPLHRYEFVPPKSFSKTFNFSIIFYSTCKISGRGQFRKECRSRKKNRNHWKSRTNSRTLLEPFLRSRKEKKLQGNWVTSNSQRILSKGSAL